MLGLPNFGHVCWHCRGGALFYLLCLLCRCPGLRSWAGCAGRALVFVWELDNNFPGLS